MKSALINSRDPGKVKLGFKLKCYRDKMHTCCPPVTLEQDLHRKMQSWMLQTLAFALTSLVLSCAETIDYYGEICDNACPCEEKDGILTDIETGAFHGLRGLRRLHLNNNKLELLRDDTFLGLESLEYLQVLILNDNLLSSLPNNLFRFVPLTHLDLRGNRLKLLPYDWLDSISYSALVGDVVCETPFRLHGRDLDEAPKGTRQPNKPRVRPTSRQPSKDLGYGNYGPSIAYQTKSPERKIESIAELQPKPYNPKKMYLTENYIALVRRSDFLEATGLDLLHLGNNRISMIQDRAFGDLTNLRRLYLNGNRIERLSPELFYGLQSLQYLFLQYNLIREIQPGTFDPVPNLQLLFLNNNLLQAMPSGVFSGLTLLRLNLRSNHFTSLPVSGVLDQLKSLIQIDLHDNPWDCTCDVVGMKLWVEQLKVGVLVDEVICKAPKKFAETDMRSIKSELLCPDYSDVVVSTPTPSSIQVPVRTSAVTPAVRLNRPGAPAGLGAGGGASSVPLSVLILSLLLVFIMSVFVAAGLFVLVMKRRKKNQSDHTSTNNSDDADRFYRGILEPDKHCSTTPAGNSLPEYPKFPCSPAAYTFSPNYDLRRPHQYLHPGAGDSRLREPVLYSPPSAVFVEPNRNEYLELKAKLNVEPDYLEVLEKQTTFSQF
ncbi:SLIT and NTRK-like family, member 5 isoform 2-like protein [Camelus ferus]|nr:SLIT and NTRK-like family, member 5 isoform 2-like protein [Camelus ferus]